MSLDWSALVRLLRPTQWVKNTFVCVGVVFGAQLHNVQLLKAVALTFVAFSLMGSTVYIFNDYLDREADRQHPTKCRRPLASGAVTPLQGLCAAAVCMSISLATAGLADIRVLGILVTYLAINCAYSLRLKHQAVIECFVLLRASCCVFSPVPGGLGSGHPAG